MVVAGRPVAGRSDDVNRWPMISNGRSQLEAVHGTRHIYVRENRVNVVAGFEHFDRIVGICHSHNTVTLVTQRFADFQGDHRFVFDNKYGDHAVLPDH